MNTADELLRLVFFPLILLFNKKRATPEEIRRFYRSEAWARMRYEVLKDNPRCVVCGRMAKDTVMNVDHIQPLHKRWDLRLSRRNLQTLCRTDNRGKGGR